MAPGRHFPERKRLLASAPMHRADDILIERVFSPAAGWLEHRLGLGQWRAAIACLNGHLAFYLAGVAFSIAGKGPNDGIFMNLLAAFFWLTIMEWVRRAALRQAASSLGRQTARFAERHFRFIFLFMLPLSLCYAKSWASGCDTASLLLLIGHLYLQACDAPPPERRRRSVLASA